MFSMSHPALTSSQKWLNDICFVIHSEAHYHINHVNDVPPPAESKVFIPLWTHRTSLTAAPLAIFYICADICDGGEWPQRAYHWTGQGRNAFEVLQPEAGCGADQEPAAQRAGPLGEAGAEVCGTRSCAGWCQKESKAGIDECIFILGLAQAWLHWYQGCLYYHWKALEIVYLAC